MKEFWKPVKGYEDKYLVSSYGRVLSLYTNSLRYAYVDSRGYHFIILCKDGKRSNKCVHRLVAKAFIPNPNNYPCVDHIDTNPSNNCVENLRWCTHKMNCANPISQQKRRENPSITSTKNNPINSIPIVRIGKDGDVKTYPSQSEAQRDGFRQSKVNECCRGKKHTHNGYRWMYLSDYETSLNQQCQSSL